MSVIGKTGFCSLEDSDVSVQAVLAKEQCFAICTGTEALELHPLQASQEHYKACSSTLSEAISVCVAAHTAAVYVQRNQ